MKDSSLPLGDVIYRLTRSAFPSTGS